MSYEPTEWARGTKITAQKLNNIERGVESVNSEYTPTTWAEGDIVTATKLNNIEQGIANASGGGGDSDFSTAEVKIINNTGNQILEQFPQCVEENELGEGSPAAITTTSRFDEGETTIKIPLYKGYAMLFKFTEASIAATGDIVIIGSSTIAISGDGTITFESPQ